MPYNYFDADLRCPVCGQVRRTSIVTKIDSEISRVHRVGDLLDVTVVDMQLSHYTAHLPAPGEPLRILEEWSCPQCHSPEWAEIVVDGGRVRSIDVVPFNPATLDRVHFVAGGLAEFFQEKTGESLYVDHKVRPDWTARLRPHLA